MHLINEIKFNEKNSFFILTILVHENIIHLICQLYRKFLKQNERNYSLSF